MSKSSLSSITSNKNAFSPSVTIPPANSRPKFISLIFTESIASSLNVKAQHLQDIKENTSKSKICVLVRTSQVSNKKEKDIVMSNLPISDNVALFRVLPMEESSTSVYAMDDLSVSSQEKPKEEDHQTNSVYLGPDFVNTNSLMAVCSLAHDGNLVTEFNKIYVNVRGQDLPISSSGWVNMCRICHGSDSYEELIGPCRCKGSVALAHLSCLERWLRESSRSHCELCLHHYEILREPKYSLLKSVLVWMSVPGEQRSVLIQDLISFCLYSPIAICSTYILMLIGENAAKGYDEGLYDYGHFIMICAVAGIAAIDFTYSTWLMMRLQHHIQSWRTWYRENCCLTILLPPRKRRRRYVHPQQQVQNEFANTEVD